MPWVPAASVAEHSPRRVERRVQVTWVVAGLVFLGYALSPNEPTIHAALGSVLFPATMVIGLGAAIRAGFHPRLRPGVRRAWRLAALGMLLLTVSGIGIGIAAASDARVMLGLSNTLRALSCVPLLTGILLLPTKALTRWARYRFALDFVIVLGSGFTLVWYILLYPILEERGLSATEIARVLTFPLADLALMFGAVAVRIRGVDTQARRPTLLLLLGATALFLADSSVGYISVHGEFDLATGYVVNRLAYLGLLLLALASIDQCHRAWHAGEQPPQQRWSPPSLAAPYLALTPSLGLLVYAAFRHGPLPWGGLVLCMLVMSLAVIGRQIIALRDNRHMMYFDTLTGLANRAKVAEQLDRALDATRRTGDSTAVLLIDLDRFKQINDTFGHEVGDRFLAGFANLLRRSVLGSDTVGRLGGDEFIVVLERVGSAANAASVADRILAAASEPIAMGERRLWARPSINIALFDRSCQDADDLLHRADMAMYVAKRRGGNSWHLHHDAPADAGAESDADSETLGLELGQALTDGTLHIRYHPVVTVATNELVAVEASPYWDHPRRGLLPPRLILAAAELVGASGGVWEWLVTHACQQRDQWQQHYATVGSPALIVTFPLSLLRAPDCVDTVFSVLDGTGLDAHRLVLKATGEVLLADSSVIDHLLTLRARGIKVAVDGLSLQGLLHPSVDIMTLDQRWFIGEDPAVTPGVDVAIRLGELMQLQLVREGNETELRFHSPV
ncbi:MAG: diguanylate cyclase [Micromonosporaceae bacterium]|nr:diguanylate cyclase [Micromonosporaceae bacterium]